MTRPAPRSVLRLLPTFPALRTRGARTGFAADRRGIAAVEFAFLALPFFTILFAILETVMIFISDMSIGFQTERMAREVRTGKVAREGMTETAFRKALCDPIAYLVECDDLKIDLRIFATYADLPKSLPIVNGVLDSSSFRFETGSGSKIMVLRVFYEQPLMTSFLLGTLSSLDNGSHLVGSASVFKSEPF